MNKLKLAVFASISSANPSSEVHMAHALLLEDTLKEQLICEIHIGKTITRFNPSKDYFLEDVLSQLNAYCHIPALEIESDVHYPEPIPIEEEFGIKECMITRKNIHTDLMASGIHFHVVNWAAAGVEEKINYLKSVGVSIQCADIYKV